MAAAPAAVNPRFCATQAELTDNRQRELLAHCFVALRGSSFGFTYLITNGPIPSIWMIVSAGVQA